MVRSRFNFRKTTFGMIAYAFGNRYAQAVELFFAHGFILREVYQQVGAIGDRELVNSCFDSGDGGHLGQIWRLRAWMTNVFWPSFYSSTK